MTSCSGLQGHVFGSRSEFSTPMARAPVMSSAAGDTLEHQEERPLESASGEQDSVVERSEPRGLQRLPVELLNECFLLAGNSKAAAVNHLFRNIHLYITYPTLLREYRTSILTDPQCQSALPQRFFRILNRAIEDSNDEAKIEAQIAAGAKPPIARVYSETMDEVKQHNLSDWLRDQRQVHSLGKLDLVPVMKRIAIDEDQSLVDFFFALRDRLPQIMGPFQEILKDCNRDNAACVAKTAANLREALRNNREAIGHVLYLDLSETGLKSLPKEIAYFSDLRILSLDRNKIAALPPEIGELKELRRLALSYNHLSHLPEEFVKLTKLNELFLAFNDFEEAPEEVEGFRELLELDLAYNHLNQLAMRELGRALPKTEIDLRGNQEATSAQGDDCDVEKDTKFSLDPTGDTPSKSSGLSSGSSTSPRL
jgi:hypothetical protein